MLGKIKTTFISIISMGSTFSIVFFSLICLLLLQLVSLVYPDISQHVDLPVLIPTIILVVLTELLYLNIKSDGIISRVSETETPFVTQIAEDAKLGKVKEVRIISSGLSSRYLFIADLIKEKVKVQILVQGENVLGDAADRKRLPSMIDSIDISTNEKTNEFLEIRGNASITSVRAIIAHYKNGQKKSILSWYTYDSQGRILGHTNPAIISADRSLDSKTLRDFAEEKFSNQWAAAEGNTVFPKEV